MAAGYFTDDSMLRRVHRERAVALSGPRALLMQAAHPLAVTGLLAHSTRHGRAYDRLARTAEVMSTIGFGAARGRRPGHRPRALDAQAGERHDQASRSAGFPAGTPYRADQPDLLLWVLFTLVDSASWSTASTWARCRAPRRRPTGTTTRWWASCSGCAAPTCRTPWTTSHEYRREMLEGDTLLVTDWARERAREIVLEPPVPWIAQPLLQTANFITIALLPDRIRRGVRLRAPAPAAGAQGAGGRRRRVRQARRDPLPARAAAVTCRPRGRLRA